MRDGGLALRAHAPGLAMCLVLGVEGTAMVLVMVSAYRHPRSETASTWQAFILAGLLDLPALGGHAPRLLYVYPAFFVVMGSGVLIAAALGDRGFRYRYRGRAISRRTGRPPPPRPGRPALPASGRYSAQRRVRCPTLAGRRRCRASPGRRRGRTSASNCRCPTVAKHLR